MPSTLLCDKNDCGTTLHLALEPLLHRIEITPGAPLHALAVLAGAH